MKYFDVLRIITLLYIPRALESTCVPGVLYCEIIVSTTVFNCDIYFKYFVLVTVLLYDLLMRVLYSSEFVRFLNGLWARHVYVELFIAHGIDVIITFVIIFHVLMCTFIIGVFFSL